MRNIDETNPAMMKPERFASTAATLTLILSILSLALAEGAAPSVPFSENPVLVFLCVIIGIGSVLLCAPRIFKWNWETKYFGASFFHISSIGLICLIPCFCFIVYGKLPITVRLGIILIYAGFHVAWWRRFVMFYRKIMDDKRLRDALYQEEDDAIYYMQRGDKLLLETQYKFHQLPRDRYFAIFILLALALVPVMGEVRAVVGLPFAHVFLMIGAFPISLMAIGFAARGWLVFYSYPSKIKRETGKRVYVDLSGKPNLVKLTKRSKRRGSAASAMSKGSD